MGARVRDDVTELGVRDDVTELGVAVMLERASPAFEGDGAKDQALHDLVRG